MLLLLLLFTLYIALLKMWYTVIILTVCSMMTIVKFMFLLALLNHQNNDVPDNLHHECIFHGTVRTCPSSIQL